MKIVWTEPARQDLREIFEYIAEENPRAARALLSEIKDRVTVLQNNPQLGRSILEKTSTFFGYKEFSACLHGLEDEALFSRALNLLSHGKYSVYNPVEMGEDNKNLFRQILSEFLQRYQFDLPEILTEPNEDASQS